MFPELTSEAEDLFAQAKEKLVCQSLHRQADIDSFQLFENGKSTVVIDTYSFTGKVLDRLEGVHRVFPYVATCGTGLEDIDLSDYDFFAPFWVDILKTKALRIGMKQVAEYIRNTYHLTKANTLNPGSGNVDIWPIEAMSELFPLIGEVTGTTGVKLNESCLMIPNKTVAGMFFDKGHDYESCAYCDRAHCPDRRVPFKESL